MGEKTKKKGSISYAKWGYIFIAPFFIIFAVFQLVPLASTIYYSFFEYYRSGLKIIGPNFVGLKNYITLLATDLPKYFGNTLILWIIGFVPQIIVSLLLAAWFTDLRLKLKGQTFFKTVIYMPNLIMASAFAMLFFALFSDNGPVNAVLLSMGWIKTPISFLNTVWGNRGLVGLMNFLMWFGNTTIMLMAAIMGVDPTLYEAAELDGCTPNQMFWKITLPLIRPILVYVMITSMIGGLQMFDLLQAPRIAEKRQRRGGIDIDQAFQLTRHAAAHGHIANAQDHFIKHERGGVRVHFARFDLGEVQRVVDDVEQGVGQVQNRALMVARQRVVFQVG